MNQLLPDRVDPTTREMQAGNGQRSPAVDEVSARLRTRSERRRITRWPRGHGRDRAAVHIRTDEEPNLGPPREGTVGFDSRGPAQAAGSLCHVRGASARFLDSFPHDGQRERPGLCFTFVCRHSSFHCMIQHAGRPSGVPSATINVGGTRHRLQPTTHDALQTPDPFE